MAQPPIQIFHSTSNTLRFADAMVRFGILRFAVVFCATTGDQNDVLKL